MFMDMISYESLAFQYQRLVLEYEEFKTTGYILYLKSQTKNKSDRSCMARYDDMTIREQQNYNKSKRVLLAMLRQAIIGLFWDQNCTYWQ